MKYILIASILFIAGCTTSAMKFKEANREKQLRFCVNDFLDKSISPKTSVKVCERIYKRIK